MLVCDDCGLYRAIRSRVLKIKSCKSLSSKALLKASILDAYPLVLHNMHLKFTVFTFPLALI
jgi:hypothetical protein